MNELSPGLGERTTMSDAAVTSRWDSEEADRRQDFM
jgi:hypothetical protein